jgi:class 3 adenylate cyclase/tetratricopeptide (TPR) repeat protein
MSLLEDALLSALRGDGGVVVIGGDAGMGKSRLVSELRARAVRLGATVMSGACAEAELSLPYLPFLEAIGNHLSTQDVPALRERLGSAADELAQLFPQMGRPQPSGGEPLQAKLRLFEAILLLLADAARGCGLLLVLEDLHWADPATRELIDYATRRLRSTNVLVLATYRTDELHRKHALLPTIQGWRRSGQARLIEIAPLEPDDVKRMVLAIFDEQDLSDEFRDFLYQRTEGNPFVLEEMLRDAIDRGDVFKTDTGWDRKSLHDMRIPRTVRDTILARLQALDREQVEVLSAAAVLGQTFDVPTLVETTGRSQAAVLSALEACVTHQLLEDADALGRYAFRHALTREAVYEDMIVPRRQQLHAKIADVLRTRSSARPVELAHHLLMAGRYDEAVVMCVAAAGAAVKAHAYSDAASLLERAIPHVKDEVQRSRLMCEAADAHWNNTEPVAARALLEEGIAGLESAGLIVEAAGHRLLLGRCYWEIMRTDLARAEFTRAKEILEKEGPSEALAIAYIRLSLLDSVNLSGDAGLADAYRAAEIAEQAGSRMAVAWSKDFIALPLLATGRLDEGFRYMEESYQEAIAGGYHFPARNAVYNSTWTAVHLGLGRMAEKWVKRVVSGGVEMESWPHYMTGLVKLHQGRIEEGIANARAGIQKARDASNEKNVWRARILLAQCLAESLRPEEAIAELPGLSSRVEGQDAIYDTEPRVRTALAGGDAAGAFAVVREYDPRYTGHGSPADSIAEAAQSEPAWLRGFIERMPNLDVDPPLVRHVAARGRLALAEGRLDDAVALLTEADRREREEGFLLAAWHVDRALVEALARSGERDAAQRLVSASLKEMDAAGARLAAHLMREAVAGAGLHAPAAPTRRSGAAEVGKTGERMVSVLFADVRGYTHLSGESAPADVADRIASLQRWTSQEVERQRGIVDKFAGDAVMATFNVSGDSVDHALHAMQAAIAIIDKAALAGLPVGAGVAVGPAVVGRLAESANVSVLGDVTNLAARLQASAGAGEIVLSEEAHRRVRAWLGEHGHSAERVELALKGFQAPVTAFKVATRAGIKA